MYWRSQHSLQCQTTASSGASIVCECASPVVGHANNLTVHACEKLCMYVYRTRNAKHAGVVNTQSKSKCRQHAKQKQHDFFLSNCVGLRLVSGSFGSLAARGCQTRVYLGSDFSQALSLFILGHSLPGHDFPASTRPRFWYLSSLVFPEGRSAGLLSVGPLSIR
jgi:hypothetical protein